jgi:hypothetical protein
MNITLTKYKTRLGIITALILGVSTIGIVATSPQAHAAAVSRYVATTGSNAGANDCSVSASPCATIQYAVDQAVSGDAIEVATGVYNETVNITKSVTLKGAQVGADARTRTGGETIINTPSGQDKTFNIKADDVTVDGFTFDGSTGTNSVGMVMLGPDGQNTIAKNNIFANNKVGIDALYVDASGLAVSNNLFTDNTMSGATDGIFLGNISGSGIDITDNTFRNTDDGSTNVSNAIGIYGLAGTPVNDITIAGNSSSNDGTFMLLMSATNVNVTNNTATNEKDSVIVIDRGVDTLSVKNNNLTNGATGIKFSGSLLPTASVTQNVIMDSNTITGMSVAGVLIQPDSIGNGINLVNNTITGNTVGLDNQSTTTVTANGNNWGCAAGPGNPGCDNVDGNVTVATWIGQTIPGVPNTGLFPVVPLLVLGAIAMVSVFGSVYAFRKIRS